MPKLPTQVPPKSCLWCKVLFDRKRFGRRGRMEELSVFKKRKFCSISCAVSHQHSVEPPTVAASRKRAHKMVLLVCEACGVEKENVSVHHMDDNPMNNEIENLQPLCLNCHGFWHAVRKRSPKSLPLRMPALFL